MDLTRIPGIDTSTALKVIGEIGVDLQRFPTVKHFTSYMFTGYPKLPPRQLGRARCIT